MAVLRVYIPSCPTGAARELAVDLESILSCLLPTAVPYTPTSTKGTSECLFATSLLDDDIVIAFRCHMPSDLSAD